MPMEISLVEFAVFIIISFVIGYIIKVLEWYCYKKYWFKDSDGIFKSHFKISRFVKDLLTLKLFK